MTNFLTMIAAGITLYIGYHICKFIYWLIFNAKDEIKEMNQRIESYKQRYKSGSLSFERLSEMCDIELLSKITEIPIDELRRMKEEKGE